MLNGKCKTLIRTSLFFFSLVSTATAFAYLPNSHTIIGRLVRNNGKGSYVIDQEVQFRTSGDPLVLREHWTVENGENMRVLVTAPAVKGGADAIHFEAIYRDGKRWAPDLTATPAIPRTGAMSPEFFEGLFHTRSTSGFIGALRRSRVVGMDALRPRQPVTKLDNLNHNPEPDVRLGRTSGVVAWIFGDPSPIQPNSKLSPAAWIEQDAFLLRRIRYPSEAEVAADHFTSYSTSLRLPRERTVTWGNNSALIRILSVKQVSSLPNREASATKATNLPDLAQVKEFYSRFR